MQTDSSCGTLEPRRRWRELLTALVPGWKQFSEIAPELPAVDQIGITAGLVWQALDEKGPLTLAALTREIAAPRDVVLQALGWLAREDKLSVVTDESTQVFSLNR
jgi:hypothetical protein